VVVAAFLVGLVGPRSDRPLVGEVALCLDLVEMVLAAAVPLEVDVLVLVLALEGKKIKKKSGETKKLP
jgi:putative NIF3 family GTP cyclohydrolase 1 type 2